MYVRKDTTPRIPKREDEVDNTKPIGNTRLDQTCPPGLSGRYMHWRENNQPRLKDSVSRATRELSFLRLPCSFYEATQYTSVLLLPYILFRNKASFINIYIVQRFRKEVSIMGCKLRQMSFKNFHKPEEKTKLKRNEEGQISIAFSLCNGNSFQK